MTGQFGLGRSTGCFSSTFSSQGQLWGWTGTLSWALQTSEAEGSTASLLFDCLHGERFFLISVLNFCCSSLCPLACSTLPQWICPKGVDRLLLSPKIPASPAEKAQHPQPLLPGQAVPSHPADPLLNSLVIFPGRPNLDTALETWSNVCIAEALHHFPWSVLLLLLPQPRKLLAFPAGSTRWGAVSTKAPRTLAAQLLSCLPGSTLQSTDHDMKTWNILFWFPRKIFWRLFVLYVFFEQLKLNYIDPILQRTRIMTELYIILSAFLKSVVTANLSFVSGRS